MTARGAKRKGKKYRIHLGEYPVETLERVRAAATQYLTQAEAGFNPCASLEKAAIAKCLSVQELGRVFMEDYADMKGLKSVRKYRQAISTHIDPHLGSLPAESLSREDVRHALKKALTTQPRGQQPRDRRRGGAEAARTMLSVLRAIINWGISESKLKRQDNPVSKMERNLPSKVRRTRVLSLEEARDAWRAAADIGYPFGPVYQLDMLTGNRQVEWSACKVSYLRLKDGLQIIPADAYKCNHVHVVPLVPEAISILQWVLANHYPTVWRQLVLPPAVLIVADQSNQGRILVQRYERCKANLRLA